MMMKKVAFASLALVAAQFTMAVEPASISIGKRAVEDAIWRREGRDFNVTFTSSKKKDEGRDRVLVTGRGYITRRGDSNWGRRNFDFDVLVDTNRERALQTNYEFDNDQVSWSENESRNLVEDRVIADIRKKYGRNTRIEFRKSSIDRRRETDMSTGNGRFLVKDSWRDFSFDATVDNMRGKISRYDLNIGRDTNPDRPTQPPLIKSPEDAAREAVRARIARDYGNQYDIRFWNPSRKDAGNLLWEVTGEAEVTSVGGTKRKFKYRSLVNKKSNVVSETTINYLED